MAETQSKLLAFTNLRVAKWSYNSAFQVFVCPAESTYGLIKTNLLVPEDIAITQTKSWVDPSRNNRYSGMTSMRTDRQTDRQTDGQTAFQLYIYRYNCITRSGKTDHLCTTSEMHFVAPYHGYVHTLSKQSHEICQVCFSTWLFLGHTKHWKASTGD